MNTKVELNQSSECLSYCQRKELQNSFFWKVFRFFRFSKGCEYLVSRQIRKIKNAELN